jgi:hypothetical protein
MIIIIKDVSIVNGLEGDNYNVGNTSATTLIAQCEEDRLAIEQFISQHVPTIDEDVMEAVWPACQSQED